jgi:dynein heavy chain
MLVTLVRSGLQSVQHKTIVATITTEVHNKDIVENLINEGVQNPADFAWQQQLKYHFEDQGDKDQALKIQQIQATLKYGYEYIGPTSRIVVTVLTDRCWITITSALHLKLGAAPAGPAGTGKTESTKDLAKALGRYCVVFNCSDAVDA